MKKQLSRIAILLVITMCLPLLAACDVSQFIGFQPTPPANDGKVEDKTEAKDDDVQDDELPKGMQMALGSDNNSYRVSSYKGTEANLVIPETYNGFPVTEIDENAFLGNKKLVSVVIPDSVEIVGNSAFKNCQRLETVTFGEYASMLCEIGKQAFFGCTTLEFIEFVGDEYTWNAVEKGKDWDKNAGMKTADKKYEVVFIETSERPTEAPEVPTEKPSEDIYTDFVTEEVSQEETATSVIETAYPETAPVDTETAWETDEETVPEEETAEDFYWSASELAESFNNGYSYMAQAILSEDGSFVTIANVNDRHEVYHNIYMNGNTVSGQYITIKYRTRSEYQNNFFELLTATVESGMKAPNGMDHIYIGETVSDGEWHTIIVDASTYHEYFMPSEEGTYKMAYLRVDYLNNVNVKEIDIAFISVTQSVEEAIEYGRDASTVKYYEKGKVPMGIDPATGEFIDKINPYLTVQEAIALGLAQEHNVYTADKYYVTGIVVEIYNTTYGNMYVEDEYGNRLTIYGSYNGDGTIRFDKMGIKPSVGDTITFYGIIGHYNNVPQMKNAWMTEIVRHEHVYNYNCDMDCNICGQTRMTAGSHTDANMDFRCDMCDNVMPHACLDENDSFTCDICEAAMMPSAESHLSIQKAIALANLLDSGKYTAEKFYVTGTVAKITSSSVYIQDEYGNQIYVTNVYNEDGTISLSQMATKPQVGDSVTVYGVIGRSSTTVRMQNGWLISNPDHEHSWSEEYVFVSDGDEYTNPMVAQVCPECGIQSTPQAIKYLANIDQLVGNTTWTGVGNGEKDATTKGFTAAEDDTVTLKMMWAGVDLGFSNVAYSILDDDGNVLQAWTISEGTVLTTGENAIADVLEHAGIDGSTGRRVRDVVINLSKYLYKYDTVTIKLALVSDGAPEGENDKYVNFATITNISTYNPLV